MVAWIDLVASGRHSWRYSALSDVVVFVSSPILFYCVRFYVISLFICFILWCFYFFCCLCGKKNIKQRNPSQMNSSKSLCSIYRPAIKSTFMTSINLGKPGLTNNTNQRFDWMNWDLCVSSHSHSSCHVVTSGWTWLPSPAPFALTSATRGKPKTASHKGPCKASPPSLSV